MKRALLVVFAAVVVLLCGARRANADGIAYTESNVATGSIGGTTFSNALVTVTFVGSTSSVFASSPGLFLNNVGTATVTIAGLGTFSFTDAIEVFDNQVGAAGIADASELGAPAILDTINSAFTTYALKTAIGPLTGSAFGGIGGSFATSEGSLSFTSLGADSTFTATTATPAPEPSSLALLLAGIGLVLVLWKRIGRRLTQAG
jgi:PEP-CTERM motif